MNRCWDMSHSHDLQNVSASSAAAADDAGRPQMPSVFFKRLKAMLPDVEPEIIQGSDDDSPQTIGTPRQLVTRLMRWVRSPSESILCRRSTNGLPRMNVVMMRST